MNSAPTRVAPPPSVVSVLPANFVRSGQSCRPLPKAVFNEPKFRQLKELDELLDLARQEIDKARHVYEDTLQEFAGLCHQLWQQEKAQGNHQGKGFRQSLCNAGIKAGRAYRAMKKFFPADFPERKPTVAPAPAAVSSALSAADKAATLPRLRFTGNLPEGKEVLECLFALTAEEKAEFQRCLKLLAAPHVQRLLLEAMKQAAAGLAVTEQPQSEIISRACPRLPRLAVGGELAINKACPRGELASRRDAGCNTILPVTRGDVISPSRCPEGTDNFVRRGQSPRSVAPDNPPQACPRLPRLAVGDELASRGAPVRPPKARDKRHLDQKEFKNKAAALRPDAAMFANFLRLIRLQESLEEIGYYPARSPWPSSAPLRL